MGIELAIIGLLTFLFQIIIHFCFNGPDGKEKSGGKADVEPPIKAVLSD